MKPLLNLPTPTDSLWASSFILARLIFFLTSLYKANFVLLTFYAVDLQAH